MNPLYEPEPDKNNCFSDNYVNELNNDQPLITTYNEIKSFGTVSVNNSHESMIQKMKPTVKITNQRETLTLQLSNFQYECTICYVKLRPQNPVWSCDNCYHIFHIDCIKKWYKTCVDDVDNVKWRCPTCQKEYFITDSDIVYHCFCGKFKNPEFRRGTVIHCCDDVCGKNSKSNIRCPHLCSIPCHPGPCPTCEASVTSKCHCSKDTLTVQCCNSDKHLVCGNKCEKSLNCSIHICQDPCHPGECDPCTETFTQFCKCQKESRIVICGSSLSHESSFSCNKICDNTLDCNNHKCVKLCHSGPCQSCALLPKNVQLCHCRKTALKDLVESCSINGDRESCLDDIPTCSEICNKRYATCDHNCTNPCHTGECLPCDLSSNVKCRCKKTTQNLKCSEIIRLTFISKGVQCSNRCKSKKSCGNHRCVEICCDNEFHICEQICRKQLSCKLHNCDRTCHPGRCPTCTNVSFDELYCECGVSVLLPPIACGQTPPKCEQVCTRQHSCSHEVLHNCHNESQCPVCIVLITKKCPGGHKELYNIPCFRPVVTCGLPCNKQLTDCSHFCIKDCHSGPCTDDLFQCLQPCTKARPNCQHPCNAACHNGDCEPVMKPCVTKVELKCSCNHKSIMISCQKLQQNIQLNKSNKINNKKDGLELLISDKDQSVMLNCDSDCKKAAKLKFNMVAFENEIGSLDSGSYTGFLRDFSIMNPDFLMRIDGEFVRLIKKLELEKSTKVIHRFEPMNRDKRRFIHELTKYFTLNSSSFDPEPKRFVTIEAVKGVCKIPNARLIHFMQKNYPQLFKIAKQTSIKHAPVPNRMFYGNKMNSIGFSKNPG